MGYPVAGGSVKAPAWKAVAKQRQHFLSREMYTQFARTSGLYLRALRMPHSSHQISRHILKSDSHCVEEKSHLALLRMQACPAIYRY